MAKKVKSWPIALGMGIVVLLGVVTFVFAAKSFPSRLQAPFNLLPARDISEVTLGPGLTEDLGIKDTDQDGLLDIQELQTYNTSPFLEDSDSDGINDKDEIDAGEDPNCPKGTDCRAIRLPSVRDLEQKKIAGELYKSTVTSRLNEMGTSPLGVLGTALLETPGQTEQGSEDVQMTLPASDDPEEIKEFFSSLGFEKSLLDGFSDEQIVQLYKDTIEEVSK